MAKSMSLPPTLDPESPYYLHPNDQLEYYPSMELLNQANDNYVIWKFRFHAFLELTNKTGFIDGTLAKPEHYSPLYHPWKRCDATVKSWLMRSMTEKLQKSVMYAETSHKMWENLRRIFVPCVDLKIYQIRRRIARTRQDGDSVEMYFGKLSKAWMELSEYDPVPECACGGCRCETAKRANEAREKEERYTFLMGLNRSLSVVTTQIMLMKPPPSLYEAYDMVERAESRMKTRR